MDVKHITVAGQKLRVATSAGRAGSIPLLVFNGLGADLEVFDGFAHEMASLGIGIATFDVPGIGGSNMPLLPYRFACLARLADDVLGSLGIAGPVDVIGMSWGGALAQEFTYRYPKRARRLVLAATSAGALAVPGRLSALTKMLDPRLYIDPGYMVRAGGDLYGGKMRTNTAPLERYGKALKPIGCTLQLMAVSGWTSAFWLHTVRQPTLIMMGADDPIVPEVNGRLLASLLPHATLVTIADGHLFLLTSARECAPLIARFLTSGTHANGSANGSTKAAQQTP